MISHDFSSNALYIPITKLNMNENFAGSGHTETTSFNHELNVASFELYNMIGDYSNMNKPAYLEERNMNVPSGVPFSIMPPPPQNIANNNVLVGNRRCRTVGNSRTNSPLGYESDESVQSQAAGVNGLQRRRQKTFFQEQPLTFGRYSFCTTDSINLCNSKSALANHKSNNSIKPRIFSKKRQNIRKEEDLIVRRVHGLMERFTSKARLFQIDPNPEGLLKGNVWDPLTKSIWEMFTMNAQTEETYLKKLKLWERIFLSIQPLQRFGLFIVGSTMTGLGTETSDVDMCLLVKSFTADARVDAISHLKIVKSLLEEQGFVKYAEVIHAKVPILKFIDVEYGFVVDLNCNNSVGIRNTHLLHCYSRLDWRVRPIVIIVKLWAQANGINEAKNMTISSYSLVLMVIHYLQSGVKPPVIPCLHGLHPERFGNCIDVQFFDIQEEDPLPNFKSDNNLGLGELFIGFLHYYSHFSYARDAISVRAGSRIPIDECRYNRTFKNDPHQWKFLCIEEPFDSTNTARSVYDEEKFKYIQTVFRGSYELLLKHKVIDAILPRTDYKR